MIDFFGDNRAEKGHGRDSARRGAISMTIRAVNAAFQIVTVLFLARLLTPEDYGLVSMVVALTGFAPMVVDLGSRDAIIQRDRVSSKEVAALFWITLATGCGLALVVAASSPLIARFYGDPRLVGITVLSSLTFITTALSCQHQALLRRALMFERLVVIEVSASVLSAVLSIGMALSGWHYWALVVRPIAMSLFIMAGAWSYCRWIPVGAALTPGVRDMLRFGLALIGSSITDFAKHNCDLVAIGRRYGAGGLGYYQGALQVYVNVLVPLSYVHDVAAGSLCKVLNDLTEFKRLWIKALSTLTFFAMPAFGVLAVTSQELIVLLLGSKWSASGMILSILALRGIPQVMERTLGWLHVPAGRTDRWMRWNVFAALVQVVAVVSGLPFGPMGVAIATVVSPSLLILPAFAYAGSPLGIGVRDTIEATGRQCVGAVTSVALVFLVRQELPMGLSSVERMGLLTVAYLTCYLLIVVGCFGLNGPLSLTRSLLRDLLPRRAAVLVADHSSSEPR